MRVLTPSGYKDPATIANGDELCAFDSATGAPIINTVENIDFVDYADWCQRWKCEPEVPEFTWYRINGTYLLFGEQSIWRNGANVCHVHNLAVGDEIYDDSDHAVAVASIEPVIDETLVWYRFDVSGDHSYIVDGITVHNASRFWVGGTGTWDSSSTTHWSATSGGSSGASVPGSADTAFFNGSSGGGTVTPNFGGTITITTIDLSTFTGTFDNSTNNNNFSIATSFSASGSSSRTITLGTATYTLTGLSPNWNFGTTTSLTYSGASANIVFAGSGSPNFFGGGGLSHGNVTFGSVTGFYSVSGTTTFNALSISAPNFVVFASGTTYTITTALAWAGTSSAQIGIESNIRGSTTTTIAASAGSAAAWCSFRDMKFTGSPTASNSFDVGNNSGITITAPVVGGGTTGFGVVGG